MIMLIGHGDQFDFMILSFFLTADHLNGLSSFGGPQHLILLSPLTILTQVSAAHRAVLDYQQGPHDSLVVQGP